MEAHGLSWQALIRAFGGTISTQWLAAAMMFGLSDITVMGSAGR